MRREVAVIRHICGAILQVVSERDLREFIRIQNARFERSLRELWERNDRMLERMDRAIASMERLHAKWDAHAEHAEQHAEQQRRDHEAMLQALFRIMDRLPPPETA